MENKFSASRGKKAGSAPSRKVGKDTKAGKKNDNKAMKVLDHNPVEQAKNDGVQHLGKDKDSDLVSLMNSNNDEEDEEDNDIIPTVGSTTGGALISSTTHSKETVNLNPTASKSSLVSGSVSRTSKSAANQQTEAASASGLMMPQHLLVHHYMHNHACYIMPDH